MKQYKLTAWPDLPPRFQKTTMRRVVSELSQRFVSVRDLARSSGAAARDIEELVAKLDKDGMLMTRATPQSVNQAGAWRQWWPVVAVRGMVRDWRWKSRRRQPPADAIARRPPGRFFICRIVTNLNVTTPRRAQ